MNMNKPVIVDAPNNRITLAAIDEKGNVIANVTIASKYFEKKTPYDLIKKACERFGDEIESYYSKKNVD